MLLDPGLLIAQLLNSLQLAMLLFLLAIGLSVVFGLMDYLNLAHGTIYMVTFGKILLPTFSMLLTYFVMAVVLLVCPGGLIPSRRVGV